MADRPEEVGDLRLATIVVNALDMDRAVAFWAAALGYRAPEKVDPHRRLTCPRAQASLRRFPSFLRRQSGDTLEQVSPGPRPVIWLTTVMLSAVPNSRFL
jgi:hypothetical protein